MNLQSIQKMITGKTSPEVLPDRELLGKIGDLSTRLAVSREEIKQAQKLRYDVFYEEMSAQKRLSQKILRRDRDRFDLDCHHLLVLDDRNGPLLVGTQRLKTASSEDTSLNFYSQSEFDVESLVLSHKNLTFMELGRSCILPDYRSKRTMELMWQGTWAYAVERQVDVMIGCASFELVQLEAALKSMKFLATNVGVDQNWHAKVTGKEIIDLKHADVPPVDLKTAMRDMPPLIKGYMRLGARFSHQAVIDQEFGTVDMLVVLCVKEINPRYIKYYGAKAERRRPVAVA